VPFAYAFPFCLPSSRNGEFDWTTDENRNSFVEDNVLYIVPTLTSDILSTDQITNGYTLQLGEKCTASNTTGPSCVQTSNSTLGQIISPVQSARLSTKLSRSIRYGKITFDARMPTGYVSNLASSSFSVSSVVRLTFSFTTALRFKGLDVARHLDVAD
jgi:hypothetical protein